MTRKKLPQIDQDVIVKVAEQTPEGHVGILEATISSIEKKTEKVAAGIVDEYYLLHLTNGKVLIRVDSDDEPSPFTEALAQISQNLMDGEKLTPGKIISFNGNWNKKRECIQRVRKLVHPEKPSCPFADFEPVSSIIKDAASHDMYNKTITTIREEVFEFKKNGPVYSARVGSSHADTIYDIAIAPKSGKIIHEGCPPFKLKYRPCKHVYAVLQLIVDKYPAEASKIIEIVQYLNREK